MRCVRLLPVLLLTAALAACGGSKAADDPVAQVPAKGGLRDQVRRAATPDLSKFPAAGSRTLQQVADGLDGSGPDAVLASSVFTTGPNRLAFGEIDGESNAFVYGPTAL